MTNIPEDLAREMMNMLEAMLVAHSGVKTDTEEQEVRKEIIDYVVKAKKQAHIEGMEEQREKDAEICKRLAEMMEQGAGELEPGDRLRQAARAIMVSS